VQRVVTELRRELRALKRDGVVEAEAAPAAKTARKRPAASRKKK